MNRLSFVCLVLLPLVTLARENAVLLVERGSLDSGVMSSVLRTVTSEVSRTWTIAAAEGIEELPMNDGDCSVGGARETLPKVVGVLKGAINKFYVETDIEGATAQLETGVAPFLEHPCLLGRLSQERPDVLSAWVLLVRLYLSDGKPEKAAALARRLAMSFARSEVSAVDVPPEVARFLEGIRADVESVQGLLTVSALPREAVSGLVLDGRTLPGGGPWEVMVPAGLHDLTVFQESGAAVTRRVTVGDKPLAVEFDLVLAGGIEPGPEGGLYLAGTGRDSVEVASRVAEVTGRTVLLVQETGVGVSVSAVSRNRLVRRDMMRVVLTDKGHDVTVARDAPFVRRPNWPWPYVSGGVGASLLVAGAVLNIKANDDAEAISAGENRVVRHRALKDAAIACYAVGGGGLAAAVTLFFLRPGPKTRFLVIPSADGLRAALFF